MKQYKIQNVETGKYLIKGSLEMFGEKGSVWLTYPKFNINRCVKNKIAVKVITYELKEIEYECF